VKTLFLVSGSPMENGEVHNFQGKLRDQRRNGERFSMLPVARVSFDAR